ncbi:MAG: aminotransferase class I/II-fold pyridoxal phosphate-dependent enzyme [candidate division Zixibacteria bacterium]|nr:aminotransferase class I/II-fold pyridoxal phosphate-dependent enzyme [candidate division Zixibacteria bacterium]
MGLLADRLQRIGESATLRISAKAKQLKAEGIDVIDLSIGEPDFSTPENIKKAGKQAIDDNFTHYTANPGIPELKQAIIKKLHDDNGLDYNPNQIIVSTGAKNSIFNLCTAILNKGDEVIIPSPYWVSYPAIVNLAKGAPVYVHCSEENGFLLHPKDFAEAITPRTKALFLNNPSNPTGAAYTKDELKEIIDIAVSENIIIIADEIYEKLVYDGFKFYSAAAISPQAKDITVIINGVSKAYSMTGWRLGYAAGPKEIIAGMNMIQGHNTSNACSISQKAAIEALLGPQLDIEKMVYEFQRRRNLAYSRLLSIPGISCPKPRGAFYLFANFSAYFDKEYNGNSIRNSYGMAYYLMKNAHVAVVPGDAFGMEGFIRLSYADSMERIDEALTRISDALAELTPSRKAKGKALNNTTTKQRDFVELESSINLEMREALVNESENAFSYDNYYEWNVNIAGVVLQLRTNSPHLNEFWAENFYPAELEADIEPHGIIYAVKNIPGREARAYYNPESHTGFFFKSAYYSQLRSLALGIVSDISEKLYNTLAVHAACFDIDGRGALMFFPPASGKSTHVAGLLKQGKAKIVSDDIAFIRLSGPAVMADSIERKFYMPADFVERYPAARTLFERSKCENVVTLKEQCENTECLYDDSCVLDKGEPYCFIASSDSKVMLDPYWLGGQDKHTKRTQVKTVLIFKRDNFGQITEQVAPDRALQVLEEGRPPADAVSEHSHPFYNPYMLVKTTDRIEQQKRFYTRMLSKCDCYLINTGAGSPKEVQKALLNIVTGQGREVLR